MASLKTVVLALALAASSGFAAASAELTDATGSFTWMATGTTYQLDDGHSYFVGHFGGIQNISDAQSPLNNSAVQCPGFNDVGRTSGGYCVAIDGVGDRLFYTWECGTPLPPAPGTILGCKGSAEYYGGTGKFAKANGSNEFDSYIVAVFPDGSASGYTNLKNVQLSY